MILASTSDLLKLITSSAANIDVSAHYTDAVTGQTSVTPDNNDQTFAGAGTNTIVGSPGSSTTFRKVNFLSVRNRHASTACDVTIVHYDGTNSPEVYKCTLAAGEQLIYCGIFCVFDNSGRLKQRTDALLAPASPAYTTVVLTGDVTNNNASANTIADVTGLKFAAVSGNTYYFRFLIAYTAAATSTGSRWSINGPGITSLIFGSEYSLTTTTRTLNEGLSAYDTPAASNATSAATAANIAVIEGFIKTSANGDVIARFASEVSSSAIVAKAGSIVQYQQVL